MLSTCVCLAPWCMTTYTDSNCFSSCPKWTKAYSILVQLLYIVYSTILVVVACKFIPNYKGVTELAGLQYLISTMVSFQSVLPWKVKPETTRVYISLGLYSCPEGGLILDISGFKATRQNRPNHMAHWTKIRERWPCLDFSKVQNAPFCIISISSKSRHNVIGPVTGRPECPSANSNRP